jgi:hypothetical protein
MIKAIGYGVMLVGCLFSLGCNSIKLEAQPAYILQQKATGSFYAYHAALGSGKGILFSIPLPKAVHKKYTIDSLYIQGKSVPFTTALVNDTLTIEANIFVAQSPMGIPIDQGEKNQQIEANWNDTLFVTHQFQPAYLLVHPMRRKFRKRKYVVTIESFKEQKDAVNDSKY